jgi:hypothetical protein
MEHIDGGISVGITALFGITKPVGVIRSEPSPVCLAQEGFTLVLEVGMSHTYGTLAGTRDQSRDRASHFQHVHLLRLPF